MKTNYLLSPVTMIGLAALFAASATQAETITITGTNITMLSSPNLTSGIDASQNSGSVTKTQISYGTLGQFNPELGVLTQVVATLAVPTTATTLSKSGSAGTASVSGSWFLGGNNWGTTLNSTGASDSTWNSITWDSTVVPAPNLNNFVGTGNIADNRVNTQISAYRSGPLGSGTSASINKDLIGSESVVYTYSTHSNASFDSGSDDNDMTIDFGQLANGASDEEDFSIHNLGGLGLTSFTVSFLSGDDVFSITGVSNVAAGAFDLFTALFNGQNPSALTNFSGTYRLAFTDNVSGLSQYASNSVGTNFVDITLLSAVAPAAVPLPAAAWLLLSGIAGMGFVARRRTSA